MTFVWSTFHRKPSCFFSVSFRLTCRSSYVTSLMSIALRLMQKSTTKLKWLVWNEFIPIYFFQPINKVFSFPYAFYVTIFVILFVYIQNGHLILTEKHSKKRHTIKCALEKLKYVKFILSTVSFNRGNGFQYTWIEQLWIYQVWYKHSNHQFGHACKRLRWNHHQHQQHKQQ